MTPVLCIAGEYDRRSRGTRSPKAALESAEGQGAPLEVKPDVGFRAAPRVQRLGSE